MTPSTIALTGATGFVGQHLLDELLTAGHTVLALHRRPSDDSLPRREHLHWIPLHGARAAFEARPPRALVHLATCYGAAQPLSELMESNVVMPLRLLESALATGCTALINTDSYFAKPEFDYPHMRAYIDSKRCLLQCCAQLAAAHPSLRVVNARLEHVYGPGDGAAKFVTHLLTRLVAHEALALSPGDQTRDFIHVRDVAAAYLAVVGSVEGFAPGVTELQIGTGRAVSIREFVTTAKSLAASNSTLDFGALPHRPCEIMESAAAPDSLAALATLGWAPRRTLVDGLQDTLDALGAAPTHKADEQS